MDASGWPLALLMLHLCRPADSAPHPTHTASPPPLQISPPVPPSLPPFALPPSSTPPLTSVLGGPMEKEPCALTISPPRLVVRFGGSAAANCSISKMNFSMLAWEVSPESSLITMGSFLVWNADNVRRWNITAKCFFTLDEGGSPCHRILPVIVYKPPGGASISVVSHSEPLREGHQYTLQCTVWDVAPIQNLLVTFYSGQTELGRLRSNDTQMTPASANFSLDIKASKEHNGMAYWCQAELQLGAQGPLEPLVVKSQNVTAEVLVAPQFSATGFSGERNVMVEVEVVVGGTSGGSSSRCEGHFLLAALLVQILNLL